MYSDIAGNERIFHNHFRKDFQNQQRESVSREGYASAKNMNYKSATEKLT